MNLRYSYSKYTYPFVFVSFSFFNMLEKNMLTEWPLTELTLFFTGLKMERLTSQVWGGWGWGRCSQNIDDVGGGCPILRGLASCLKKTHWTSLLSMIYLKMTQADTWQSSKVFREPTLSRHIWS